MIKLAEFVSDKQLAKLLGISVDVIRSHRKEKKRPAILPLWPLG